MTGTTEVLREGTWFYAGEMPARIRIVRRDWDWHHEPGFDPDPPSLGPDGWAYYVEWAPPSAPSAFHRPSPTCLTFDAALALAEQETPGEIRWGTTSIYER